MMLNKVIKGIRRLATRYPAAPATQVLRGALAPVTAGAADAGEQRIAVQCVEDPLYFALFSAICQDLRAASPARPELVIVRSINGAVGHGWLHAAARSALVGAIVSAQWLRAYRGLVDRVAYRSQSLAHPFGDLADWLRSRAIWRQLRDSDDVAVLSVQGVPVGDLIIDSYLRFRPSPRFDARDPFVARLLWQAHRDIRRARAYFRQRRPQLYLTSYSTYIEHGIAARVALQEGVHVRSFGNFTRFGKRLTLSDWFHTPNTDDYRSEFATLDAKDERLARADAQLRLRLSGGIDAATSYMKVSAYAASSEPLPDVKGAVVVFLHDFYDSPHIYADLVFPDFWSWICFTIDSLQRAGRKFYLKPHPNQIALSGDALLRLQSHFPGLPLLSTRVTNAQLAEAGMLCGVTVYGTVAHELAYFGVPTIACARHPHHSFTFCRTARTVDEYARYLQTPGQMPVDAAEMRRQALEFYYMHNLHGSEDQLALRQRFIAFWKACNDVDTPAGELVERFRDLRSLPAFKAFVASLLPQDPSHAS
jgi:hypothetical protein